MKIRNSILKLHNAIGILTGFLLIIIGLSGTGIVFHEDIDRTLNPSLYHVTPLSRQVSFDVIVGSAVTARPDLPIWFVQTPKQDDDTYVVNQKMEGERRWQTFVNPYTGAVLGSRIWESSFVGFLYTLHHELFLGKVGQAIVGFSGLFLLLMAVSGAMLWPGWRSLRSGFTIRRRTRWLLTGYDLHKVIGILSSVFFLISAITGILIVILHFLPIFEQDDKPSALPSTTPVALQSLIDRADGALPEGKISSVEFSEKDQTRITVRKKLPYQETSRFDLSSVELDRNTGKVLRASKVVKAEGLFNVIVTIADLHFGTFGGLPTRILYLFVGLMPTALLISGLAIWKHRSPKVFGSEISEGDL